MGYGAPTLGPVEDPRLDGYLLESDMEPVLGWVALSRAALKRAEAQMVQDSEGVRDEIGVLALHTGYANRFFPGTSVQQTRLRYSLFVPWQIQALLRRKDLTRTQIVPALRDAELALAKRLLGNGNGVIGRTNADKNRPVSIPPSQSYWVALGAWQILATSIPGEQPSRARIFSGPRGWADVDTPAARERDDDDRLLHAPRFLFHRELPKPIGFDGTGMLDFALLAHERTFLRERLLSTRRTLDGQPSFLSALVRAEATPDRTDAPWSPSMAKLADAADRAALDRARHGAAMSAVARALYAAAVEHVVEATDGRSPGDVHRLHLHDIVLEHGDLAVKFDADAVMQDGVILGGLQGVLAAIGRRLREKDLDPAEPALLGILREWERRKGTRAKLATSAHGQTARESWEKKERRAEPINYRWNVVRQFLHDLAGS